jgi:histidyl-tRNA synthetase
MKLVKRLSVLVAVVALLFSLAACSNVSQKYADKINAHYVAIIGDDELDQGIATVKNMKEGDSKQISLDDLKKGNL